MKSFKTPTTEQVEKAISMLGSAQHYRYFFDKLQNPKWIEPLRDRGFFSCPPKSIPIEGGGIRYPHWQAAKYLSRMAEHEPVLVADILSDVETDSPSIVSEMIEAALKMPPPVAAQVAGQIASLLNRGAELFLLRERAFRQLVRRLTADSATEEVAFDLAKACLFPGVKPESRTQRREQHNFFRTLEALTPLMVQVRPEETIRLLCGRLVEAIRAKGEPASGDPIFDYSHMWRPAIEEHKQNRAYDLAGRLVTPLRNAAELAVSENYLDLERVLQIVRSFEYLVFKRLAVHLINVFADQEPDRARETMMRRDFFEDYRFKHEYAMLVGNRFGLLEPSEKDQFFAWIDEGPDMSRFEEWSRSERGRDPTDQERENRKRYWQYERLWWIREHLEGKWKAFFDEMLAEHGEPKLADLNIRTDTTWGPESPIKAEGLARLPLGAALKKVLSWRPTEHERGEALAEGLQGAFAAYVQENVEACSRDAELMIGKPAMLVRPFVSAMQEGVNSGKAIQLEPIFELCRWVIQQPREQDTRPYPPEEHDMVDPDWQWCRDRIVDFVSTCCKKLDSLEHRESLWDLLEPLTHDPDTDYISSDEQKDIRFRDFLDQSLNNPRAHAVNAVFDYVQWVAGHMRKEEDGKEVVPGGFDAMPEVRSALKAGLESGEHGTSPVRAAYGRHLGTLYRVDKDWLASKVNRLLELETIETDPAEAYGWAAWNSFLVCVPPHIAYFTLLEKQFKYAVDQFEGLAVEEVAYGLPAARLGEHLIVLYGRGQLGLDEHDRLLRRFLSGSGQHVRSYAISFVGRSLNAEEDESKGTLLQEVVDRFVKLWEWYWPEVGSRDEEPSRDLFSYWYQSRCFPRDWALEKLSEYVKVVPSPEPEYGLPERLAEDAELDPQRVLSIIETMIEADKEGWRIGAWEAEIRQILSAALKADEATRAQAIDLVNRLGSRGWISLGELLRPTHTES